LIYSLGTILKEKSPTTKKLKRSKTKKDKNEKNETKAKENKALQRKASENLTGESLVLKEPILNQLISIEDKKSIWRKRFSEDLTDRLETENERTLKTEGSTFKIILDESVSSLSDLQEISPDKSLKINPFNVSLIQNQVENELFQANFLMRTKRAKSSDAIHMNNDSEYQTKGYNSASKAKLKKLLYNFSTDIQEDDIIQIAEGHMKKGKKDIARKRGKSSDGSTVNKTKSFVVDSLLRNNESLVKTKEGLFKLGEKVVFDPCQSLEKSSSPLKFSFDGWRGSIDEVYADEEYSERENPSLIEKNSSVISPVKEEERTQSQKQEKANVKDENKEDKEPKKIEVEATINLNPVGRTSRTKTMDGQVAKSGEPLYPQNVKAYLKEIPGFSGMMYNFYLVRF